ncbi:unnamed protein product [Zymoseptoria tritici ST99CH_1A5]|uniref:Uncharacterized protein n=1 Tax=Zymoseptoria tritici ST99CH_1A5 TaxID=1276529 RepID=A0A1Y6LHR0_ZYMTR|nr:unnamed protein product [Zymoseptoria tritici ST99CH_1A5]
MESAGGSSESRRNTVSGPRPDVDQKDVLDNEQNALTQPASDAMRLPLLSMTDVSPPTKPTPHKRSGSGSILGRFNFLRNSSETKGDKEKENGLQSPKSHKSSKSIDDDAPEHSPISPEKGESAMAAVLKSPTTRKRKGSLRKTALLGGRKLAAEGRERRNSLLSRSSSTKHIQPQVPTVDAITQTAAVPNDEGDDDEDHEATSSLHSGFSYEQVPAASSSSSDAGWSRDSPAVASTRLALLTDHRNHEAAPISNPGNLSVATKGLDSPMETHSRGPSYASTTDDDDMLTFDVRHSPASFLPKPLTSAATSYFPIPSAAELSSALTRSLSSKKHRKTSPLSHSITNASFATDSEQPHDYTETEYWGWVILIVTWITFAVGMGSCLEIWSWAWDVGETPYAPPELEDDPTLPIVGYYPALIVLTGVVSWVWITVAWIGMKYFRHAKIEV